MSEQYPETNEMNKATAEYWRQRLEQIKQRGATGDAFRPDELYPLLDAIERERLEPSHLEAAYTELMHAYLAQNDLNQAPVPLSVDQVAVLVELAEGAEKKASVMRLPGSKGIEKAA